MFNASTEIPKLSAFTQRMTSENLSPEQSAKYVSLEDRERNADGINYVSTNKK